MKKVIIVTMPDNSQWQVPCDVIAEDRAVYYSEDTDKNKRSYDEVYNETMADMDLLIDWGENNMNWSYLKPPSVDYEDGWCNGHKRVAEFFYTVQNVY